MEQTIQVGLGERSYPITIGPGVMEQIGASLQGGAVAKRFAIISDDNVAALYGERVQHTLRQVGVACELIVFPHGEASKNLSTIDRLAS